MDLDDPRVIADRLKGWWSVYVLLASLIGALCGGITVGLAKLTVYYLAEQASMETLADLKLSTIEFNIRLKNIDATLLDQKAANTAVLKQLDELGNRVTQIVNERATEMSAAMARQNKNTESILLLLQQQPSTLAPPKAK